MRTRTAATRAYGGAIETLVFQLVAARCGPRPPSAWLAERTGLGERYIRLRFDYARGFRADDLALIAPLFDLAPEDFYRAAYPTAEEAVGGRRPFPESLNAN